MHDESDELRFKLNGLLMQNQSVKNIEEKDDYGLISRNLQSNILDVPANEKGYNTEKVGSKGGNKW